MLTYQGKIVFDPPLNDKEYLFFNNWQNLLTDVYYEQSLCDNDDDKIEIADKINHFLDVNLDSKQLKLLMFAYNPHITITKNNMLINGTYKKGQLREALLSYEYFFIGDEPILKNYLYEDLYFINKHNLSGLVEAQCYDNKDGIIQWCYIFTGKEIYSVNTATIKKYEEAPNRYPRELKQDKLKTKIKLYFPKEFVGYAKLNYITARNKTYTQNNKLKI